MEQIRERKRGEVVTGLKCEATVFIDDTECIKRVNVVLAVQVIHE